MADVLDDVLDTDSLNLGDITGVPTHDDQEGAPNPGKEEFAQQTTLEKVEPTQLPSKPMARQIAPGVVEISLGTKISRVPFERFKATTSKKDRISVISNKIMAIKTHYSEETGYFACFGGRCCEVEGMPSVRYLLPIVVYDTDKNGKPVSSEVECKVLSLAQEYYDAITVMNESQDITQQDIVVICSDEKYQKCQYASAGPAMWRKSQKVAQFVADFYKKNKEFIPISIAKQLDEASYLKLKDMMPTGGVPGVEQSVNVNFDEVFGG